MLNDREKIIVETMNESYSIYFSHSNFKKIVQREKDNPHVLLIKLRRPDRTEKTLFARRVSR